jgi:hypothetical protein
LIGGIYIGITLSFWICIIQLGIGLYAKNIETNFTWSCEVFFRMIIIGLLIFGWAFWFTQIENMD